MTCFQYVLLIKEAYNRIWELLKLFNNVQKYIFKLEPKNVIYILYLTKIAIFVKKSYQEREVTHMSAVMAPEG